MSLQISEIGLSRNALLKWLGLVCLLKILIFSFFTIYRSAKWPEEDTVKGIALIGGDTPQYYKPLEAFTQGEGYQSICRMPGLLPFYAPLRTVLSEENTKVAIVIFQMLFDVIATVLLAITAARLFGHEKVFRWTCLLYGFSTFVSIRSNYLLSDSFNASTLIISFYFLSKYLIYKQRMDLLFAGVFVAWSLFFRPVTLIAYPCAAIIIFFHYQKKFIPAFKSILLYALPAFIALSLWTTRNYYVYGKPTILIAGADECMNGFTPQQQSIRNLIITMGEDFQPWSAGSAAEWFLQKKTGYQEQHPFAPNDFAKGYNLDSLITLKEKYAAFNALSADDSLKKPLGNQIVESAKSFAQAYKTEHTMRFWLINRINFIKMFLFPSRLDDLPLPAATEMNVLQKAVKAASFILLLLVHALACLAMAFFLWKKKWLWFVWGMLPFAFVIVLGYMGYIEQRYLTAAYPFMVMLVCGSLSMMLKNFSK